MTVAHQYSWLSAAVVAQNLRLPLHLILHDDPWFHTGCPGWVRGWFEAHLNLVCHQATSLLCVSPNMVEFLKREYGVQGSVLYPSWGPNEHYAPREEPLERRRSERFTIAYAGNLFSDGYRRLISDLATLCASLGFRFLLFSDLSDSQRAQLGLIGTHVQIHSTVPPQELPKRVRSEAHATLVPMSFESRDRRLVTLGFPSKLSEYTGLGLPLVIWGPPECSAVRWGRENADAAETIQERDPSRLALALNRLANNPAYRQQLAATAFKRGRALFSYDKVVTQFVSHLSGTSCFTALPRTAAQA